MCRNNNISQMPDAFVSVSGVCDNMQRTYMGKIQLLGFFAKLRMK